MASIVSTGALPSDDVVAHLVDESYETHRSNREGEVSRVYPALAAMPPDLFGVCVVAVDGRRHGAGDVDAGFSIMSVAKPFVFALVCDELGPDDAARRVGMNATGLPFDSLAAIERVPDGRTNPMVNPGAIATTSLVPGDDIEARWRFLQLGLSRFAGRQLALHDEVYRSASATNHRNRAMVDLLRAYDRLGCEPDEALDLYTRQSSLRVTAGDLAVMGATLAGGGVQPADRRAGGRRRLAAAARWR